jgi:pimeloyl-ACP methyl ester carboxylesterase
VLDDATTAPERHDVRFVSVDAECAAWHYGPGSTGACVVMAHGLGAIKELGLDPYARAFASAGHSVLAFDYRGLGASDGNARQVVDIAAQQVDWRAAIDYARTLPGVERIALWGTSYSGGHVLSAAAELGDEIAAAITQIPMADGLAAARGGSLLHSLRLFGHGLYDEIGAHLGRDPHLIPLIAGRGEPAVVGSETPEADLAALNPDGVPFRNEIAARFVLRAARFRPVKRAHAISCPLLVIVCEDDELTPPRAAVDAARRAGRGELVRLPGGHYALYGESGRAEAIRVEVAFLGHQLVRRTRDNKLDHQTGAAQLH